MTFLFVGVDRQTLAPWQRYVYARDVGTAHHLARARAKAAGIDLVVAAVIGPGASVLPSEI